MSSQKLTGRVKLLIALGLLLAALLMPRLAPLARRLSTRGGGLAQKTAASTVKHSMVLVLLGRPYFQYYLPYSVAQLRLWSGDAMPLYLVVTPEYWAELPKWHGELVDVHKVKLLNYSDVVDQEMKQNFVSAYLGAIEEHDDIGKMLPTVLGRQNDNFQLNTIERFVALHGAMKTLGLTSVLHMENDQMTYASMRVLSDAADACNVNLAIVRNADWTMAASIMYIRHYTAMEGLLNYIIEVCKKGYAHATEVAHSAWVTDMSLTAAYWNQQEGDWRHPADVSAVRSLPPHVDNSCMYRETQRVFDPVSLGQWCCGIFQRPNDPPFTYRDRGSEIFYWDYEFEWRTERPQATGSSRLRRGADEWRVPYWNGSAVFNLHIHSKKLWLYKSLLDGTEDSIDPKTLV